MIENKKKKGGMSAATRRDFLFMLAIFILPAIQYAIETVWIKIDTIILAFNNYTGDIDDGYRTFAGFYNIKEVLDFMFNDSLFLLMLKNNFLRWIVPLPLTFFEIIITYYMFRKFPGTSVFRTIMYIPMMTGAMASVLMSKFFVSFTLPSILGLKEGLLNDTTSAFWTLLIYGKLFALGGSILGQLAVMNSTDQSTLEAGQLDGVGFFGELWHIVLPKSYKFIFLGIISGIGSIFTSEGGLIPYYGTNAPTDLWGIGYYTQIGILEAEPSKYPYYAAFGVVQAIVLVPLSNGLRALMNKVGPSED
ncbi:MAG: sugar ABC transporter permease [Clostridia bacterium]|nr:sugar ABC transporter permease [Clostridia bacterium]